MISPSEIEEYKSHDFENNVECGYSLRTLLRYNHSEGIYSKIGPGISKIDETYGEPRLVRYAMCPHCHQGWYFLKDASSCLTGHKGKDATDPEEDRKHMRQKINRMKAESVFQHSSTILMKRKYAIISISRILADNFVSYANTAECLVIRDEKDLRRILIEDTITPEYQLIFLGRPSNYLKHFTLEYDAVRKELEKIEAIRDAEYLIKQGDSYILCDKWDLPETEGEVFIRSLVDGRPGYSKA